MKSKIAYVLFIIVCLLLSLFVYQKVEASIGDWLLGGTKTIEVVFEPEVPKTIDSEIDRLSIKYGVASSTVRAVAKCESSLYGGAVNENKLADGTVWSRDYFYLQINDYYHKEPMTRLGLDFYNQWDSLEYGIRMMSEQGLQPWSASKLCWSKLI